MLATSLEKYRKLYDDYCKLCQEQGIQPFSFEGAKAGLACIAESVMDGQLRNFVKNGDYGLSLYNKLKEKDIFTAVLLKVKEEQDEIIEFKLLTMFPGQALTISSSSSDFLEAYEKINASLEMYEADQNEKIDSEIEQGNQRFGQ